MSSLSKRSEKRGKIFTEIATGILPSELIVSEWVGGWVSEWVDSELIVSVWVSGWVSELIVSEWVSELIVSEWVSW